MPTPLFPPPVGAPAGCACDEDPTGDEWRAKLAELRAEPPLEEEPTVEEPPPPPVHPDHVDRALNEDELDARYEKQKREVKGVLARRIALDRRQTDPKRPIKLVQPADESRLHAMEADMAKRFGDKVAAPARNLRKARRAELEAAGAWEFARGNELYDKGDYISALAEYEVAARQPRAPPPSRAAAAAAAHTPRHAAAPRLATCQPTFSTPPRPLADIRPYVFLNRGNAYKAVRCLAEAATCYQHVLDEASLSDSDGRVLHSCALLNLATVREDERRTQQARASRRTRASPSALAAARVRSHARRRCHVSQALQNYAAALALNPRNHLAAKDRACMHLRHADRLLKAGAEPAAPPQHELSFNLFNRTLDIDWQLPKIFQAAELVVRLEVRTVRAIEIWHCTFNLTHVGGELY